MKAAYILSLVFISTSVFAQDDKDSKVIVIEEGGKGVLNREKDVKVEAGEDEISGDEASTSQAARREWTTACAEWKKELKINNGKDLMVANCGKPSLKEEMRQSEKYYKFESMGKYKIRVSPANSR